MHRNQIDRVIGKNLNRMRTKAGYTQKELGEALPVPLCAQAISKCEMGASRISSSHLVEFARILKCPVSELFEGVGEFLPEALLTHRTTQSFMKNYGKLTAVMQESLRELVNALIKETSQKLEDI